MREWSKIELEIKNNETKRSGGHYARGRETRKREMREMIEASTKSNQKKQYVTYTYMSVSQV